MMDFREDSFEERLRSIESLAWRPRPIVLPWLVWAVVIGLALGAALYPALGNAAEDEPLIVRQGQNYVRIAAPPCPGLPSWHTGDALLEGKRYKLCWKSMQIPQPHVRIVFEDGDIWTLPHNAFQPESMNPPGT